jgi:hypothetical protein
LPIKIFKARNLRHFRLRQAQLWSSSLRGDRANADGGTRSRVLEPRAASIAQAAQHQNVMFIEASIHLHVERDRRRTPGLLLLLLLLRPRIYLHLSHINQDAQGL